MGLSQFPLTLHQTQNGIPSLVYDSHCANRVGLRNHLTNVPQKGIFKLSASAVVGERFTVTSYHSASPLSVVGKIIEKLVNNGHVDDIKKCDLFAGFRYFRSIADLMAVLSDRFARVFSWSGAICNTCYI